MSGSPDSAHEYSREILETRSRDLHRTHEMDQIVRDARAAVDRQTEDDYRNSSGA